MIQPIRDSKDSRLLKMFDVMYEALHSENTNLIEKLGVLECLKIKLMEEYLIEDETDETGDLK